MGELAEYDRRRDFGTTPEPRRGGRRSAGQPRFVVQEHHATRLHWDFRLEHGGVLVSWAVPRGIPADPRRNHLAVHVEDHPLGYIDFAGDIPAGYGAGKVAVWDRGTYEPVKWRLGGEGRQEVQVVLHGERVSGRYALFQTDGKNWMMHRMDPPADPDRVPLPARVVPMMAKLARSVPADDRRWGYEFKWDGIRALAFVEGGSLRLVTRNQEDVTRRYPELRGLAEVLGSTDAVLDGEIVALDPGSGRPSFERLQQRMGLTSETDIRRRRGEVPVVYMAFDAVHLDGRSLRDLPYTERRARLEALGLDSESWQTPPWQSGEGQVLLDASARAGLEGVMAKRLDSRYEEGGRSGAWLKIKNHGRQELVIGGWLDGRGRREGVPGAILVGHWSGPDLVYAGKVGTGFTDRALDDLARRLEPLAIADSPFTAGTRPPRAAHFVRPELVCEVEFNEWTRAGQLRAPSFKGLRADKDPRSVVREVPA